MKRILSIAILMTACTGVGTEQDSQGQKADDLAEVKGQVFHVLDNEIECVTAPCPKYTAISEGGRVLKIVADEPPCKLDNLTRRPDALLCDPESIVHVDWSDTWRPEPA